MQLVSESRGNLGLQLNRRKTSWKLEVFCFLMLASNNSFDILRVGLRAALTKDFLGVNRRGPIGVFQKKLSSNGQHSLKIFLELTRRGNKRFS